MELKIKGETKDFLDYISSDLKNDSIAIVNLDRIIYNSKKLKSKKISYNMLKFMLKISSNKDEKKYYIPKLPLEIIENDIEYNSQIICPIFIKETFCGCIIFNSMKKVLDLNDINFIKGTRTTITYLIMLNNDFQEEKESFYIQNNELKKFFDSEVKTNIINLLENEEQLIYSNKEFLHIIELLKIKIDMLSNKLVEEDIKLLNEILDLTNEKQIYYALYSFILAKKFINREDK